MANYGEPDWASPGSTAAATQEAGTGGAITANNATGGGSSDTRGRLILTGLSLLDFVVAALMGWLGILTLIKFDFSSMKNTFSSEPFLAVYMVIFAVLLFTYELMWWMGIPWINKMVRMNFGFMYGLKGKGLYLIFVAFLTIGLKNDNDVQTLTLATGISYLAVGVCHLAVVLCNPDINEMYRPPTAGLKDRGVDSTPNPV